MIELKEVEGRKEVHVRPFRDSGSEFQGFSSSS